MLFAQSGERCILGPRPGRRLGGCHGGGRGRARSSGRAIANHVRHAHRDERQQRRHRDVGGVMMRGSAANRRQRSNVHDRNRRRFAHDRRIEPGHERRPVLVRRRRDIRKRGKRGLDLAHLVERMPALGAGGEMTRGLARVRLPRARRRSTARSCPLPARCRSSCPSSRGDLGRRQRGAKTMHGGMQLPLDRALREAQRSAISHSFKP